MIADICCRHARCEIASQVSKVGHVVNNPCIDAFITHKLISRAVGFENDNICCKRHNISNVAAIVAANVQPQTHRGIVCVLYPRLVARSVAYCAVSNSVAAAARNHQPPPTVKQVIAYRRIGNRLQKVMVGAVIVILQMLAACYKQLVFKFAALRFSFAGHFVNVSALRFGIAQNQHIAVAVFEEGKDLVGVDVIIQRADIVAESANLCQPAAPAKAVAVLFVDEVFAVYHFVLCDLVRRYCYVNSTGQRRKTYFLHLMFVAS